MLERVGQNRRHRGQLLAEISGRDLLPSKQPGSSEQTLITPSLIVPALRGRSHREPSTRTQTHTHTRSHSPERFLQQYHNPIPRSQPTLRWSTVGAPSSSRTEAFITGGTGPDDLALTTERTHTERRATTNNVSRLLQDGKQPSRRPLAGAASRFGKH